MSSAMDSASGHRSQDWGSLGGLLLLRAIWLLLLGLGHDSPAGRKVRFQPCAEGSGVVEGHGGWLRFVLEVPCWVGLGRRDRHVHDDRILNQLRHFWPPST